MNEHLTLTIHQRSDSSPNGNSAESCSSDRARNTPNMQSIAERILAGDKDAEATLYETILKGLSFWLRHSSTTEEKLELASDVFIIVLEAIRGNQIRKLNSLSSFILTVAKRTVIKSRIQRSKLANRRIDFDAELIPDPYDGREDMRRSFLSSETVEGALLQLKALESNIIRRFYIAQQDKSEICRELGLTETQFRVMKHRAKQKLLQKIQSTKNMKYLQSIAPCH